MAEKRLVNIKFETNFIYCSNDLDYKKDGIIINELDSITYDAIKKALIEIINEGTSYRHITITPFTNLPIDWDENMIPYSNTENEKTIKEILNN